MEKVRWGILSTAAIGLNKVIPAMQRAEHCHVEGIASRDRARAEAAAKNLGIPKVFGSYEELLADGEIEAIYNPLPNHLHVSWSIRALEAGKHVLCEKPIGLSAAEGEQLVQAARRHPRLKVMEAFMYRHHPQWKRARSIVAEGSIGPLRTIQAFFSYHNVNPANIRNQADLGGGGLMDIGCYPISVSRFLYEREPLRVAAIAEFDPVLRTDRLTSAILDFGSGTSSFTCSTQLVPFQRVNIFGTQGRVDLEIPFNAPSDRPCRIWHHAAGKCEEIAFPACDQYGIQGDLFSLAIRNNTPVPTPIDDAVGNMRVIEAVLASQQTGTWVAVNAGS